MQMTQIERKAARKLSKASDYLRESNNSDRTTLDILLAAEMKVRHELIDSCSIMDAVYIWSKLPKSTEELDNF